MNISDIIAVSSTPGLHKMVHSRNNGLILKDLDTEKTKFYTVRKYQFTPLETVAIYTMSDTEELKVVFEKMQQLAATNPLPGPKASNAELSSYFAEILPDYDRDRVYPSDVKKIVKWYRKLESHGLLVTTDEEE